MPKGNPTPARQRFDRLFIPEPMSGCYLWMGTTNGRYGTFDDYQLAPYRHRNTYAHRWSFQQHFGAIPAGMEMDHKCRNILCVNPDHLEAVTHLENVRRTPSSGFNKTHCKYGHEFSTENTWVEKTGSRHCRECHRLAEAKRRAKSREKKATP